MKLWSPSILEPMSQAGVFEVDNHVFLLGLDYWFREAMKVYEMRELLPRAREVARALKVDPAQVPVEGYYSEAPELEEYFLIIRALQAVDEAAENRVGEMVEFRLLWDVFTSGLYGLPQRKNKLLPVGRDPLTQALDDCFPDWTVEQLTAAACQAALRADDVSLVGLAARAQDPVVLAALRESVVLGAEALYYGLHDEPEYTWRVDGWLEEAANRFIAIFNRFDPGRLPEAGAANAKLFAQAYEDNEFIGRCARIAMNEDQTQHYHWAVAFKMEAGRPVGCVVDAFWDSSLWTTDRYRDAQRENCRLFSETGVPGDDWFSYFAQKYG